jgi:hypothetical protein
MTVPTQLASPTLDYTVSDRGHRLRLTAGTLVHADSGWQATTAGAWQALGAVAVPFLAGRAHRFANPPTDYDT